MHDIRVIIPITPSIIAFNLKANAIKPILPIIPTIDVILIALAFDVIILNNDNFPYPIKL